MVDRTNLEQMYSGIIEWNKHFTLYLENLEPPSPTIISMTLYKKRSYWFGFDLIGSCHFATADLASMIDKGPVRCKAPLHVSRRKLVKLGTILLKTSVQYVAKSKGERLSAANTVSVSEATNGSTAGWVTPAVVVPPFEQKLNSQIRQELKILLLVLVVILACALPFRALSLSTTEL